MVLELKGQKNLGCDSTTAEDNGEEFYFILNCSIKKAGFNYIVYWSTLIQKTSLGNISKTEVFQIFIFK